LGDAREKHVGLLLWYNSGGPHNVVTEQPRDRMHLREVRRKEFAMLRDWGIKGVKLTVSFLDNPPKDLRKRILQHMNAWSKTANVKFVETAKNGQVRIAREGGLAFIR